MNNKFNLLSGIANHIVSMDEVYDQAIIEILQAYDYLRNVDSVKAKDYLVKALAVYGDHSHSTPPRVDFALEHGMHVMPSSS